MREIKFRAWDMIDKEMFPLANIDIALINNEGSMVKRKCYYHEMKHIKVMQYIGPKDKNGKEIYEGDIVENNNGVYLKIYWNEELLQFRQRVYNKNNVEELGYEFDKDYPTDLDLGFNLKKVIGNIYENKELLDA